MGRFPFPTNLTAASRAPQAAGLRFSVNNTNGPMA